MAIDDNHQPLGGLHPRHQPGQAVGGVVPALVLQKNRGKSGLAQGTLDPVGGRSAGQIGLHAVIEVRQNNTTERNA